MDKRFIATSFMLVFVAMTSFAFADNEPPADLDPFADVIPNDTLKPSDTNESSFELFFSDNFGFRKEMMSQFGTTGPGHLASRQSLGFEVLKKFSTETKTFLGIDFQGRLVRRDGFVGSINDMEGIDRSRWFFEYHNAYADFYELFGNVGRFNARIGRFYVPFGLNLQTDTHGPVLQLSNERNFGFERDWYAGLWGILSDDFRYDAYYLVGSGYDLKFKGQSGLGFARMSLSNRFLSEYGLEAGISIAAGKRLDPMATSRNSIGNSTTMDDPTEKSNIVSTIRTGIDGRYRHTLANGLLTWSSEFSGGRDQLYGVFSQLYQVDFLHASRRFGIATQFRWFWQDFPESFLTAKQMALNEQTSSTDSSLLADATWYFSNDVAGSNLHWIKLNCEYQLSRQNGDKDVIWTLQYYHYW